MLLFFNYNHLNFCIYLSLILMTWKLYNNYDNYSGNNTTINRLSLLLKLPITNNIEDYIIGIHIIKFGLKVFDKNINYGLIIGGTDIYDIKYNLYNRKDVLDNAKFIVVFNNYMYHKILGLTINKNIFIIRQSFIPMSYNILNNTPNLLLKVNEEKPFNKVFLFIGNLRKIKDPFYLKNAFDFLYENYKYLLVFIGDNNDYDISLFNGGYYYLGALDYQLTLTQLINCNGIINSSIDEGMSSVIIEALYYKVPVFARNNEGNLSFDNIFIYENSEDFLDLILQVNDEEINYLVNLGKIECCLNHNPITEKLKYKSILYYI
jgi:hypothetical protein